MKDKDKIKSSSFSLKISVLILLVFCIVIVFARYTTDEKFRQAVDTNIFRIRVEDSSLKTIEIDGQIKKVYTYKFILALYVIGLIVALCLLLAPFVM